MCPAQSADSPPARHAGAPARAIAQRVAPFAIYMAFIAVAEAFTLFDVTLPGWLAGLYPLRVLCVAAALAVCLPACPELGLAGMKARDALFACFAGVVVLAVWLALDVPWGRVGAPAPFDPQAWGDAARPLLLGIRFAGAAVVVPLAEELFWRSFLLRHLQGGDFREVPLTRFHPLSFTAVMVLFGLEHNMVLAGMAAGAAYNLVALRTGSVACCVLAHAVTNGLLGWWVLQAGAWHLW